MGIRVFVIIAAVCFAVGCKPVNFAKRSGLGVDERARAVAVLHVNAKALSIGDVEALERTMHPDSPEMVENIAEQIERFAPVVELRGLKIVSEKPTEIVVQYEQVTTVKRGALPFSSAILQTRLMRDDSRWGIFSTRMIRAIR